MCVVRHHDKFRPPALCEPFFSPVHSHARHSKHTQHQPKALRITGPGLVNYAAGLGSCPMQQYASNGTVGSKLARANMKPANPRARPRNHETVTAAREGGLSGLL